MYNSLFVFVVVNSTDNSWMCMQLRRYDWRVLRQRDNYAIVCLYFSLSISKESTGSDKVQIRVDQMWPTVVGRKRMLFKLASGWSSSG